MIGNFRNWRLTTGAEARINLGVFYAALKRRSSTVLPVFALAASVANENLLLLETLLIE